MASEERPGMRDRYAARGEDPSALRAAVAAEFVGTFILILLGTGAIAAVFTIKHDAPSSVEDVLLVGLAWGLAVMVVIYALGHVSGVHINPAVTIALAVRRRFPATAVIPYVLAQVAGALLGSLVLWGIFGEKFRTGPAAMGGASVGDGFSMGTALLAEVVITFVLMLVIMGTATDDRADSPAVGLGVGFTVAALVIAMAPVSGAALNPARALGPALVSGSLGEIWIYIAGPIVGAVIGAFVYDFALRPGSPPELDSAIEEGSKDGAERAGPEA